MGEKLYFKYWGKARPSPGSEVQYHLLPYHCLDVAACHQQLWQVKRGVLLGMAEYLCIKPDRLLGLLGFFATVHDIGKFSFVFQRLQVFDDADLAKVPDREGMRARHDQIGYLYWIWWLNHHLREPKRLEEIGILELLGGVAMGHHGIPPANDRFKPRRAFTDEGREATDSFIGWAWDFWGVDDCLQDMPNAETSIECWQTMSWILSAMIILADWIGSDASVHKYQASSDESLEKYFTRAEGRAKKQINALGLSTPPVAKKFSTAREFLGFSSLTPQQSFCEDVEIDTGPVLFILEDVTGAGKTEAALILAARMLSDNRAGGFYFGLPTMATADSLFERLQSQYEALYEAVPKPSLVLSHGAAALSAAFIESIGLPLSAEDKGEPDVHTASSWCNSFYTDNKKKALLADLGVGTIDQALLAILQTRHQSLRLFGLLGKVLILDEIHSYEGYTAELICCLIRIHTLLGGSTIVLSATLSQAMKQKILDAFYSHRKGDKSKVSSEASYPWITYAAQYSKSLREQPIDARSESHRCVSVEPLYAISDVINVIRAAVAKNHCIAWIRNTVKEAILSFDQIQLELGLADDQIRLFHSRYTLADRQAVQNAVLHRFGKYSKAEDRKGQVVISTQVIEQSLDLDFDILISDICPVDLIIQRAGRLQRHLRDRRGVYSSDLTRDHRPAPIMYVLMPHPGKSCDKDWLAPELKGTGSIYPDWSNLWLTQQALLEKGRIKTPDDSRWYMDAVYDKPSTSPPAEFVKMSDKQLVDHLKGLTLARGHQINFDMGYRRGINSSWLNETPTRLGEETTTLVLVEICGESLQLLHCGMRNPWEMSSLAVRSSDLCGLPPELENRWSVEIIALKDRYRRQRSDDLVMPVKRLGSEAYEGIGLNGHMETQLFTYSDKRGLEIRPS